MDRRLAALMSEPLPALPGCNGGPESSGLLLMPASPSSSAAQAHAPANDANDFFNLTSVPGSVPSGTDTMQRCDVVPLAQSFGAMCMCASE